MLNLDRSGGHVEPTAVLGRIVPEEALDQPPCLFGREGDAANTNVHVHLNDGQIILSRILADCVPLIF
jgi:hypothetical protein